MFNPRAKRVCAAVWVIAWLGVAVALLMPLGFEPPGRSDLVGHFLLFGSMAFCALGFSRRPGHLAWFTIMTIALGSAFEYAQTFVPYRSADVVDAVADGVGALGGYAAALLVLYLVIRPAEPKYSGAESWSHSR